MDVFRRFQAASLDYPNSTALDVDGKEYSYGEFSGIVNGLSRLLTEKGDKPTVLIALDKCVLAYAGIMATLGVNGCFCSVDVDLPLARIISIASQVEPDFIFANGQLRTSLQEVFPDALVLSSDSELEGNCEGILPVPDPDGLAYIIFTSGSTGSPKGVMVSRQSINMFIESFLPLVGVNCRDRWAQYSSLGFDLSLVDILCTFSTGACLIPVKSKVHSLFPDRAIREIGVTIWHSVPSVIELITKTNKTDQKGLGDLRLVSFCGEILNWAVVDFLRKTKRDLKILNTYGPTEGTVFCSVFDVPLETKPFNETSSVPSGKAIGGWEIIVKQDDPHEAGEIVIRSNYLSSGYLDGVDHKEAFATDDEGVRTFATGDFAKLDPAGNIIFTGRRDRQIKVGGRRFELGELDAVAQQIARCPVRSFFLNGKIVSAIEDCPAMDEDSLISQLSEKIPTFALPTKFLYVSNFPRNSNFKVDMIALKQKIIERYYHE
jgi:D-alanine--poly(phosphoribitol) ligase subunit 1